MNLHQSNWSPFWFIVTLACVGGVEWAFGASWTAPVAVLVLIFAGMVLMGDWVISRVAAYQVAVNESKQEAVKIMRLYAMLTPDEKTNLQASRIVVDYVLNFEQRLERWHIPGMPPERGWYPTADVKAVWDLATADKGMPPVGSWSEGTIRRECAVSMVRCFVDYGYLRPAAGNMSAQWVAGGYEKARKALLESVWKS